MHIANMCYLTNASELRRSQPAYCGMGDGSNRENWMQTMIVNAGTEAPSMEKQEIAAPARNVAVDAYRGLVMLLMMGEVLNFATVAHAITKLG